MSALSLWKYQILSTHNHNVPVFAYAIAAGRQHARDAFIDWLNNDRRYLEDEGAQEFAVPYPVYILGDVIPEQDPKSSLLNTSGPRAPRLYLAHLTPTASESQAVPIDYLVLTRTPELIDSYLSALNTLPEGYHTDSIQLYTSGVILFNKFDVRFSLPNMRPYLSADLEKRFKYALDDQTRWSDTGLRTRSVNSLERAGISTVGDFVLAILAYGAVFQIDTHSTATFTFGQNHLMFGDRELTLSQIGTASWLSLLNFVNEKGFPWIDYTRNASKFKGWIDRPVFEHLQMPADDQAAKAPIISVDEIEDAGGRYALCYPRRTSAKFINMITRGEPTAEATDDSGSMPVAGEVAIYTVTKPVEIYFEILNEDMKFVAPEGTRLIGNVRSLDSVNRNVFLQPPDQPGQLLPLWSGKLEKVDTTKNFLGLLDANALHTNMVEEDYLKGASLLKSGEFKQAALYFERALSSAIFGNSHLEALHLHWLKYAQSLAECYDSLGLIWKALEIQNLLAAVYTGAALDHNRADDATCTQYASNAGSLLIFISKIAIDYGNNDMAMTCANRLLSILKGVQLADWTRAEFDIETAAILYHAGGQQEQKSEALRLLAESDTLLQADEFSGSGAQHPCHDAIQNLRTRATTVHSALAAQVDDLSERNAWISIEGCSPDDVAAALHRLEAALGTSLGVVSGLTYGQKDTSDSLYRIRVKLPM